MTALDEGQTELYNQSIGRRLRAIRKQKGMSLQDVEAKSDLEFKASVLGAYERGERSLSLPRLQRLAGFYGVPVDQLLPPGDRSAGGALATDRRAMGSPSTSPGSRNPGHRPS